MENEFITWMDRFYLEFPAEVVPDEKAEEMEILIRRGFQHEETVLKGFNEATGGVFQVSQGDDRYQDTIQAMRAGHRVIYQAALQRDVFAGYADFLVRVERPSGLGNHSYEVCDAKLAHSAKPSFVIQLCCYADLLEGIQGRRPNHLTVLLGNGSQARFRTDDFFFYYLTLKEAFLKQQCTFNLGTRPEPLGRGQNGRWETEAKEWLEREEHLRLVAGIATVQIQRLNAVNVRTVKALAELDAPRIPKMLDSTYEKLRSQARLQIQSRGLDRPAFELIPPDPADPRKGLALLPPACGRDVVLDLEGFPLIEGGLEYLFGIVYSEGGELHFKDWWAHNPAEERIAFEGLMDWICERRSHDLKMHVYHYAPYETAALCRLMGKYGSREQEIDDLLRHEVFIDLYRIVRQGVRIGTERYSLKAIECLYRGKRETEITGGGESIVFYQRWLDTPDGMTWETSPTLNSIRDYNSDDCTSTWSLKEWLHALQLQHSISYIPPLPPKPVKEDVTTALAQRLIASIPLDRSNNFEHWRVRELLAWLVEFYRRENRPVWWAMFDRHEMTEDELYDDADCLARLVRTNRPAEPIKKSTLFEYEFDPDQDTKFHEGSKCYFAHDLQIHATVEHFDGDGGRVGLTIGPKDLSKLPNSKPPQRLNLIPNEYVGADVISASIARVVSEFEMSSTLSPALDDFLFRRKPRFSDGRSGRILPQTENPLTAAIDAVGKMDNTTLCFQGPPGSGKTYSGAHVILSLLKRGKRVGVSANSHKAICNLMSEVARVAKAEHFLFLAAKVGEEDESLSCYANIEFLENAKKINPNHQLIGGTAWVFSNAVAQGILSHLFVDEAGQVSLANLVGMSPSTRNIVLLGDQMQLSQPTKGAHPGESGLSTLDYLLQGKATIPDDMGIFLATTWRMRPELCKFISEAIYEGRLKPEPLTQNRYVIPDARGSRLIKKANGLLFMPVLHEGNTLGSEEEVAAIKEIIAELIQYQHTDEKGNSLGNITMNDILIVAPYNMQVRMLKRALGTSARIGTIDKFQGQEATVVIVSMCSSAADASPRGVDFLLDKNRLNVAISRAKCLAVIVGHPGLARTRCSTLNQMELSNLFCRAVKEGIV